VHPVLSQRTGRARPVAIREQDSPETRTRLSRPGPGPESREAHDLPTHIGDPLDAEVLRRRDASPTGHVDQSTSHLRPLDNGATDSRAYPSRLAEVDDGMVVAPHWRQVVGHA